VTGPEYRTWAEVSLRQVRENFRAVAATVGRGVVVAPVVKADAYGHGAVPVSRALINAGATWLAVSCVQEGVALRQSGIDARVLVMGGLLPFEREAVFTHRLTPVAHSLDELRDYETAARPLTVHLKVDTGMSRLGATATPAEVVQALRGLKHLRVEGLMSHFASAEDFTSEQTLDQVRSFEGVCEALREAGSMPEITHLASTNPIAYGRRETWNVLVRPGLAIYGYVSPSVEGPLGNLAIAPALTWYARLLKVREIGAGTPVGYMARFRAPHAMRIGTVAAGYADGLPHRLSTRGNLVSKGRTLPILGAVSMDLTTVDLTAAPELQVGDAVTVLGPGMDAQRIAELAGEIPYSVLGGIGNRVRRVYIE